MGKTTLFITHDLDEAIRMGSRIAIMKDGVIVQIGTPEDIVTNPADDYVADFVKGISRLKLVYAHTVMTDPDAFTQSGGSLNDLDSWSDASPEADLDALISLSVNQQHPVAIRQDGNLVGVVTKDNLLRGIQGEN